MTPSWYDVLGVEPTAETAEIRAAWKAAVADLDPGDRRFRSLNRAAEVLLDDERRRAHDRELAADAAADDEDVLDDDLRAEETPAGAGVVADVDADDERPAVDELTPARRTGPLSRGPSVLVTAALGVVAVLVAVAAVVVAVQDDGGSATDSSASSASSSGGLPDAREVAAARSAAEAAVVPVLSYDFRRLEQDKQAALSYMTPAYAEKYEQLFASVIAPNAPSTETVVSVEVQASGIVRTGPDLVDVLLFVDRPTVNREQTTPEIYKDQATLRMRDVGGDWLVDCVISGVGSTCED